MSFANPTPIQIGARGTFNGGRYRVAGRVVLGCDVDGQRYYWNEFHLVRVRPGDEATLVHEEGEHGIRMAHVCFVRAGVSADGSGRGDQAGRGLP